jgi:hypothetical protein
VLARGNLYYSSDDITDRAANEYRSVVRRYHPRTKEAEAAQYLLASYYHRKFYIVREKKHEKDDYALNVAEVEYNNYIRRYMNTGSREWLAECYFNLSLIWLEYGKRDKALEQLNKLRKLGNVDGTIYVYDVIWSPHSNDRVEGYYDQQMLVNITETLIKTKASLPEVVQEIRKWCRSQRK